MEPSRLEQGVMQRIERAKLVVWLCEHRHELLDARFPDDLPDEPPNPVTQPPHRLSAGTRATQRMDWPKPGWRRRSRARSAGTTRRS